MNVRREGSLRGSVAARSSIQLLAITLGLVIAMTLSPLIDARSGVATGAALPSGCGGDSPGSTTLSLKIDGFTRTVIVKVPANYTNKQKLSLVLNLHGSGSTALNEEGFSGMDQTANSDHFIVAYPQALIPNGSGFDWNVPDEPLFGGGAVPAGSPNDIKFLVSLVKTLEKKYCVDPLRVYATGHSGGAREASQLACDASSVIAAVAPVDGLRAPSPCHAARAVPVIAFHGSADPIDPFNGNGQAYWTYSVPVAAQKWATFDKCSPSPKTTKPAHDVVLTSYRSCANGAQVQLYEIIGEGHEWPGGPTLPSVYTNVLGPQSNAINANQLMWSFFKAHPL